MAINSAIKILVVAHEYPPIGGGGGKVVKDLCEGIASDSFKFYILTALFKDLHEIDISRNLTIERIKSNRTDASRAGFFTMACFVWGSFWRALRIIRIWNPDIIHAHFAVPGGASAALAALIARKPYIISAHGGDVPGGTPKKTDKWFRIILPFTHFIWKNASKIITVSKQSRALAQKHYPVQIDVIPNGIDTSRYSRESLDVRQPPCILFIGRFSPEKNALAVPEVLSRLKDLAWTCKMIGDGPQLDQIQSMISRHHLNDRIDLTGWIEPSEVDAALFSSDILLMPSFNEGMPMTGLQGLASGNALVLSDVGACSDMVEDGKNGFLVDPGNIEGYVEAMRSLLTSQTKLKRFKKHSLRKAHEFDIQKVLDAYRRIYLGAIEGKA